MKILYLASHTAYLDSCDVIYQDINGLRDIPGDMLDVDLNPYDFIIATPPCNFWSRANILNRCSSYSLNTSHLLPDILNKLILLNKPFIVENVRNRIRFSKAGLFDLNVFVYFIGRHTYFTNIFLSPIDVDYLQSIQLHENIVNLNSKTRQGGFNVNCVFNYIINNQLFLTNKLI